MTAISAAAHDRLVSLRRYADDETLDSFARLQAGDRYRDAVTMAALMSGQVYEDIDAAIRAEALIEEAGG